MYEIPAKIMMALKGKRKISWKATIRKMFLDWNSTRLIIILAPHHEFWPEVDNILYFV